MRSCMARSHPTPHPGSDQQGPGLLGEPRSLFLKTSLCRPLLLSSRVFQLLAQAWCPEMGSAWGSRRGWPRGQTGLPVLLGDSGSGQSARHRLLGPVGSESLSRGLHSGSHLELSVQFHSDATMPS